MNDATTTTTTTDEFVPMAVDYEETSEQFEERIVALVEARMGALAASKISVISLKD